MTKDEENLRLLSIFHYVVAAFALLFSCFPLIYVAMGVLMLSGKLNGAHQDPMVQPVGWFVICIGTFFFLSGLAFVGCLILAGRSLKSRRHYTFCLVAAALACMFMPFGTVLGALTIVVLQKDSVRQLFGHVPPSPPVLTT